MKKNDNFLLLTTNRRQLSHKLIRKRNIVSLGFIGESWEMIPVLKGIDFSAEGKFSPCGTVNKKKTVRSREMSCKLQYMKLDQLEIDYGLMRSIKSGKSRILFF